MKKIFNEELITTANENYKQKDNLIFFKTIKKGGNFDYLVDNIEGIIFRDNLKFSDNCLNNDLLSEFLTNYVSIVLSDLNIDEVNVYIDKNARTKGYNFIASADNFDNIFLPLDILNSLSNNIFYDFQAIAHELKHIETNIHNASIIKKIGIKNEKTSYPTNEDFLRKLGFSKNDIDTFYLFNKHECIAFDYGYDYAINLAEKIKEKVTNKTFKKLCDVYKVNISHLVEFRKFRLEKCKGYYDNVLIPTIYAIQNNLFDGLIVALEKRNLEFKRNKSLKETPLMFLVYENLFDLFKLLDMFENINVLNKIKNYTEKNYQTNFYSVLLNDALLGIKNYDTTKKDYENYIKYFSFYNCKIDFERLGKNIDKENLIENYIDIQVNTKKLGLSKEEIINNIDIKTINKDTDLFYALQMLKTKKDLFENNK